jgi:hypothetical protein
VSQEARPTRIWIDEDWDRHCPFDTDNVVPIGPMAFSAKACESSRRMMAPEYGSTHHQAQINRTQSLIWQKWLVEKTRRPPST